MVKRAQSALEYMMTYGWAILIIVIVAAVLYSMGIFSPSSSVSSTSSGFSPFTPTATVCNASTTGTSLAVAFSVGGLPNGATSAKLWKIFVTPSSGMSGSVKTPTFTPSTVQSSSVFTVAVDGITCTTGVKFSGAGIVEFNVTTTLGTQTYNASGTIAGTGS